MSWCLAWCFASVLFHATVEAADFGELQSGNFPCRKELVERLNGVKTLGCKQIQLHTVPGHEDDMMERWAGVMAEVNG